MKNNRITPVGLKGNQINERMKELMGIAPINENKSTSSVELTKMGPDGNAYAIIRENREWYIKKADKTTNLVVEDFKYIGGLQNKKMEAYPSYSAALKRLNFKFKSLAEAHNFTGEINIVENDNLISEAGIAGFSEMKGNGFVGEVNMSRLEEKKDENNPWAICTASVGREDKDKYERCVMDVKKQKGIKEEMSEEAYMKESMYEEDVQLSEAEKAIDKMMTREEFEEGEEMSDKDEKFAALAEPKDKITYADKIAGAKMMTREEFEEGEEMSDKDKKFAALAEPKDKITYADKIAGAKMNEGRLSIAKLLESIEEEENANSEVKKKV
jgi:hypothetical protein